MTLESLKSAKFNELEPIEMNRVIGGASELTVTWTKSTNSQDDSCDDCDNPSQ